MLIIPQKKKNPTKNLKKPKPKKKNPEKNKGPYSALAQVSLRLGDVTRKALMGTSRMNSAALEKVEQEEPGSRTAS